MHTVFYREYDPEAKQWRVPSGPLATFKNFVKRQIGYPVKTHPDADDLARFFENNLGVGTSLTSSFVTVSLKFKDPVQAQNLLQTILITTDDLERRDMRADVAARLTYLAKTLERVTQTEQRDALITILSTQEQTRMMIAADKRFAVNLVDPAHANTKPTFPNIRVLGLLALLLAAACWGLAVYLLPPQHRLLAAFARSGPQRGYSSRSLPE
jgi:hypothetical protein